MNNHNLLLLLNNHFSSRSFDTCNILYICCLYVFLYCKYTETYCIVENIGNFVVKIVWRMNGLLIKYKY